jgi:hypothetical protein
MPPLTPAQYEEYAKLDPILKKFFENGNTFADIENAVNTGDLSGIKNAYGMPFLPEETKQALSDAEAANKDYYDALKSKETADAESNLRKQQLTYQQYLIDQGEKFQTDKSALDQTAAEQGVLFSGGRVQKQQNLQKTYETNQATKFGMLQEDMGQTARDYQYLYGNDAAKGLNQYYKQGGNTYNPNVATGGVGSSGLSNIYKTGAYDFQGTKPRTIAGQAASRAYGIIRNTGYKTTPYSYGN